VRCPTCKAECGNPRSPFAPFCSERCKLVDLGRWLNEEFRIPGDASELEDERDSLEEEDDERHRR
jgi:endogenous inhibitor of DNA gyrase (YacG/DUF329 family)